MAPQRGVRGWLSSRLRTLRRSSGMRLEDLSDAIGVSTTSISTWENGEKSPSPQSLKKLAEVFQVPTWEFVNITPDQATLFDLRCHAGMTQQDVEIASSEAGLAYTQYGRLERGDRDATPEQVAALARCLQLSVDTIHAAVERSRAERRRGRIN